MKTTEYQAFRPWRFPTQPNPTGANKRRGPVQ